MNPLVLALLLVSGDPPPTDAAPEPDSHELFERGEAHYAAEDYEAALHAFRLAYAKEPRPSLYLSIGLCLQKLGEHDLAVRAFERYLDENPLGEELDYVEALLAEARARLAPQEDVREAEGEVEPEETPAASVAEEVPVTTAHPALLAAGNRRAKRAATLPSADDPGVLGTWLIIGGTAIVVVTGVTLAAVSASQPPTPVPTGSVGTFDFRR
jgi:hypothetical protein